MAVGLIVLVARATAGSQRDARAALPTPPPAATLGLSPAATARPAQTPPVAATPPARAAGGTRPTPPAAAPTTPGGASSAAAQPPPAHPTATPGAPRADHVAAAQPRPTRSAPPPADSATPQAGPAATPVASGGPPPHAGQVVALTFDAGADRGYTEDILDLLRDEHVPATFGITGQWARANADLVQRMAADGHLVVDHTLDHRSFTGVSDRLGGLSAARRRAELEDADAIIAPLIGHTTRPWYRLPYGDDDAQVGTDVAPAGYTRKVGWTIDSLGWRGASATDIVARCLRLAAPGAIYVLHVGRASQDGPALGRIVSGLREAGYGFVTVAGV